LKISIFGYKNSEITKLKSTAQLKFSAFFV